jgi:protein SCO1/2
VLEGKDAPDFTLTDALNGNAVTLSTLRGRVVALSFLYTRCPDTCPLTAAKFRAAQKSIGTDTVSFVAVSVDPDGDTPAAVRAFSEKHDLSAGWRYLIGTRSQLQAVWALYGVGAFGRSMDSAVDHNDAIFVIDRQGRERELVHSDIAVGDLVKDLRAVSGER